MLDSFNSLLKLLRFKKVHIDGYVFRLHCFLTVLILMAFLVINSTTQLVGKPIACTRDKEVEDLDVVNNWCYIRGIHSNRRYQTITIPGVYIGLGQPKDPNDRKPVIYYQWVWVILLIEIICFYFPRWLWKGFEGGKISLFVSNVDYLKSKEEISQKVNIIVDYLYRTHGYNDWYAIKYFFCELLALFNVFVQMWLIHVFLDNQFMSYGYDWLHWWFSNPRLPDEAPMDIVFPIQSKCFLTRFGPTGAKETLDFFCILSINVFNQIIFLILWFLFLFLGMALNIVILFRVFMICFPIIRYHCCRFRFELSEKSRKLSRILVCKLGLGDWFLLYLLGQNMEPIIFGEILEKLCEKLKIESSDYSNDQNIYNLQEMSKM